MLLPILILCCLGGAGVAAGGANTCTGYGPEGARAVSAGTAGHGAFALQQGSLTPVGPNVVVQPRDTTTGMTPVTVTFSSVTQAGATSLTTHGTGPAPPSGFKPGNPATYYQLSTTAVLSGPMRVCINYSGTTFSTPRPRLFQFEHGTWVDVGMSLDTTNKIICASISSLSSFALFEATATTPPITIATAAPGPNTNGRNNTTVTVTPTPRR